MPSTVLGNPAASGPQIIYSGNLWSGQGTMPIGGIQLRSAPWSSGTIYVGFSGNVTMRSGGMLLSGGGLADGMPLTAGDSLFVPRAKMNVSGQLTIWAWHDAECSGQGRLFWQEM